MSIHISQFANELRCKHCGQINQASEWPERGDWVPFYHQDEPGRYTLTLTCPHCGKEWYVVWDDDPGPIKPLGL
jgi:Zn finger protein HypA/HybF involved in hydrogenase expression